MKVMLENGAFKPERAHSKDAGLDIRSRNCAVISPHSGATFHTGVHVQIPEGCCGLLVSKSGLLVKHKLSSTGLIDEGYCGEIVVELYNRGYEHYLVEIGDKITQLVILPVKYVNVEIVDEFDQQTERGSDGFGSTGR